MCFQRSSQPLLARHSSGSPPHLGGSLRFPGPPNIRDCREPLLGDSSLTRTRIRLTAERVVLTTWKPSGQQLDSSLEEGKPGASDLHGP